MPAVCKNLATGLVNKPLDVDIKGNSVHIADYILET
jgi:hypothetical protein